MIRRLILVAALLLPGPAIAQGETVVAGLSRDSVAITARFDGSDILIYGAVRRESPPPADPPLEVIVTIEGPSIPVTVRRKERHFGLWINTEAVKIDAAPSFYAVASTGPLDQILSETEDLRRKISFPRAIRAVGVAAEAVDAETFMLALIRIREGEGAYVSEPGGVKLAEATLFRADVELPANLTEGDYQVRIFLLRGGNVLDENTSTLDVRKEGLERWLTNLAHQQSLAYGLLSVLIAVVAGWGASAAFRLLQR